VKSDQERGLGVGNTRAAGGTLDQWKGLERGRLKMPGITGRVKGSARKKRALMGYI